MKTLRGIILAAVAVPGMAFCGEYCSGQSVHTSADARPAVISPGSAGQAPSDAVILFDGSTSSLSAWTHTDGRPVEWSVADGCLTIKPGSGSIVTRASFQDVQYHVEFASPKIVSGEGQGRGNSGVYLQSRYEVQVLDSFGNETYADGQCGAIYGQYPPLVNASRAPGEWQSYDIVFRAPRFDTSGKRVRPGTMTVLQNGVLIHDHVELKGPTTASAKDKEGPEPGPIYLQDHGCRVSFRNLWIRPLQDPAPVSARK